MSKKSSTESSGIVKLWLILYNMLSFVGWSLVLYKLVDATLAGKSVYGEIEPLLQFVQTTAIFEILHAFTGLVKSQPLQTIVQVNSRLFLVWGVLSPFPQLCESEFVSTMVLAWSVTEVVRYSFYTLQLIGSAPYFLLWMRYTFFFVLYPMGAGSECILAWYSREFYSETMKLVIAVVCVMYVPGLVFMYTHMIYQRKKTLGKVKNE
jgi:very-long-chain (3R)-3-hydroxyacyl-CoA dehydratase